MSKRILIVEDDATFRSLVEDNLVFEGYRVDAVADGNAALNHLRTVVPDLIVLDLGLPDCDGLDLCRQLRRGGRIPIIILSARAQKADKIKGLELGADDYVTKPTDLEELLARISAVLRRTQPAVERLTVGRLLVDFRRRRATMGRVEIPLTHHEFKLLQYLAERPDRVVHREELLVEVWEYLDPKATTRSVDQVIYRLRQKIEPDPHHPAFIQTAHGNGYCLSIPAPHRGGDRGRRSGDE
jgi:DNA-binding response OmpR family regulator